MKRVFIIFLIFIVIIFSCDFTFELQFINKTKYNLIVEYSLYDDTLYFGFDDDLDDTIENDDEPLKMNVNLDNYNYESVYKPGDTIEFLHNSRWESAINESKYKYLYLYIFVYDSAMKYKTYRELLKKGLYYLQKYSAQEIEKYTDNDEAIIIDSLYNKYR